MTTEPRSPRPTRRPTDLHPLTPDGVTGVVRVPIVLLYLKDGPIRYADLSPEKALDLAAGLVAAAKIAYAERSKQ